MVLLLSACTSPIPSITVKDTTTVEEFISNTKVYLPTVMSTHTHTLQPSPTLIPTPTSTVEILEEGVYDVTLNGEDMLKDLQVLTCSNQCDVEEVTELLMYKENTWKVVQDYQMLYTHSGRFTDLPWDMEFGEPLRQLFLKDSLKDATICISDDKCLQVVDYVVADYADRSISTFDLFSMLANDDYVLVLCMEPTNPYSPERIFIHLRMID